MNMQTSCRAVAPLRQMHRFGMISQLIYGCVQTVLHLVKRFIVLQLADLILLVRNTSCHPHASDTSYGQDVYTLRFHFG